MNGKQTIYLGFENERMRFHNYVWLEVIAISPKTEYFNAKYTIVEWLYFSPVLGEVLEEGRG